MADHDNFCHTHSTYSTNGFHHAPLETIGAVGYKKRQIKPPVALRPALCGFGTAVAIPQDR